MVLSLSFFWDKYIKLIVIIYYTLVWRNFYFKWLRFEIFEVQMCQISFGKHTKTLTLDFNSNQQLLLNYFSIYFRYGESILDTHLDNCFGFEKIWSFTIELTMHL